MIQFAASPDGTTWHALGRCSGATKLSDGERLSFAAEKAANDLAALATLLARERPKARRATAARGCISPARWSAFVRKI